jgi:diphthamide synthase subunit DPH2
MSGVEAAIGFSASVLGIASAGISVASTLMRFSASYKSSAEKIEDLSSRVSLTATILTTVGNTIENHKDYFKEDDFRGKFGRVTERCKKDYGILGQALSKARSEVDDLASERERKVRKMTP